MSTTQILLILIMPACKIQLTRFLAVNLLRIDRGSTKQINQNYNLSKEKEPNYYARLDNLAAQLKYSVRNVCIRCHDTSRYVAFNNGSYCVVLCWEMSCPSHVYPFVSLEIK